MIFYKIKYDSLNLIKTGEWLMTELIVGLAGNPNVGKTTVFNQLTGMRQ
ncbi:MAG: 50S ribosome-binding GTPase, partial [Methanobrevibacter sp.]|nr:50S ribosome-binding GTPase [Methanobrevibacter sp.]